MTFIKQPIAVDSTVSDTLANQRSGQIFGIAVGSTLAALALTLHEVRRQKKPDACGFRPEYSGAQLRA